MVRSIEDLKISHSVKNRSKFLIGYNRLIKFQIFYQKMPQSDVYIFIHTHCSLLLSIEQITNVCHFVFLIRFRLEFLSVSRNIEYIQSLFSVLIIEKVNSS